MLLLDDAHLDGRRAAAREGLAPLYDSLSAELEPLLGRDVYIPHEKALLSRAGGRCDLDGAVLDFDPATPSAHRCPVCGKVHTGDLHHRAWITAYQLWLAERAVHAALFHVLRGDARHAAFARDVLRAYAGRYLEYPNRDNVLGPTRLFFSTYLESIWLLQICVAADLLAFAGDASTAETVRERIILPSSELIAEYDEGMSNRQVWNNAALIAAAASLRDQDAMSRLVEGGSGVQAHLSRALLADGTWYEGENYHQFALRGLWYCVTMCERLGIPIGTALRDRFDRAFAAPFLTALPDFTMPSRKDSQYAVSLRQWRVAELTELGLARSRDARLAGALARCYEQGHERRDTGRARSTADVERNGPSSALTRADLGWRALLHALPSLPRLSVAPPRSALLENQGLAVFRREAGIYVALDYGQSGGGHGHPDRLNLTLSQQETRWLDDLGTGSYVDPSLHWYRSTLAHNAPLVGGRSQDMRDGVLLAHDEREGLGWIVAQLSLPNEVIVERTVVVAPEYVIDEVRWRAPRDVRIELPLHLEADVGHRAWQPAALDGDAGIEDGFAFVSDVVSTRVPANEDIAFEAQRGPRALRVVSRADRDVTLFRASAPGQPATSRRRFYVTRAEASDGVVRSVLAWSPGVTNVLWEGDALTIACGAGERHRHRRDATGWHVELFAAGARSSVDLAGLRAAPEESPAPVPTAPAPAVIRRGRPPAEFLSEIAGADRSRLLSYDLGEKHYRRSEEPWSTAGRPRAAVAFAAGDRGLVVYARVDAGDRRFQDAAAVNLLDNEHADTMGSGIQLYLRTPLGRGAWMLVPDAAASVRVRSIPDWGAHPPPTARWRDHEDGYEMRVDVPLPDAQGAGEYPIDVDVIVNETIGGRERRRGQLVLSGGRGEFVYLRGDRHDVARLVPLMVTS